MKIILYLWEMHRMEWKRTTLKEANVKKLHKS